MEWLFSISVTLLVHMVTSCLFTDKLSHNADDRQKWLTRIKSDGSNDVTVIFKKSTIEWNEPKNSTEPITRWRCFMKIRDKYFVKSVNQYGGYFYRCLGIRVRSKSVIQLEWSPISRLADPALCSNDILVLDPWVLISFTTVSDDFTSCPISGGFDIKHAGYYSLDIRDSKGYDIGCNLMNIPMRLEFDCIAGEGGIFNFRTKNCVPDVRFNVYHNTVCAAAWAGKFHHFVLLRSKTSMDFWCARVTKNIQNQNMTELYLYSDLACLEVHDHLSAVKYVKFELKRVVYPNICADEYPQCNDMQCNEFTKLECQKTCGLCNPNRPPGVCYFPKKVQGHYLSNSRFGNTNITFTSQVFSVDKVGDFRCIVFEDSPIRSTKTYTTVTISENGCRPRYTCLKFKRLGPSALRYSLGQSLVWPVKKERIGANICDVRNFRADGDPVRDLYRSYQKTGKPILQIEPETKFINCGINSSYTIRAELPDGSICHGGFYQHCKNNTKLRFDFHTCNSFIRPIQDYSCAAIFRTNYWERAILIQNAENISDIRCLVFNTLRPYQALIVLADECDKMTSGFINSKIRFPIMKLHIRPDVYPCKTIQLSLKDVISDVSTQDTKTSSLPLDPIKKNKDSPVKDQDMNSFTLDLTKNRKSVSSFRNVNSLVLLLLLLFQMVCFSLTY